MSRPGLRLLGECAYVLLREEVEATLARADNRLHRAFEDLVDSHAIGAISFALAVVGEIARLVKRRRADETR